ncbi:hypothetical protein FQA39_LY18887 [Lamprigera yunnana]|nr:hypothetical protein FQA39_LY18887 [Lamprigera yunnana]
MQSEQDKIKKQLRPDAPAFVPIIKNNSLQVILQHFVSEEPQCSRYSRKSVRLITNPNGPRPILGTRSPFPRPILGRKQSNIKKDEGIEEYIGMEFTSISRKMQRIKFDDEENGKGHRRKNKKLNLHFVFTYYISNPQTQAAYETYGDNDETGCSDDLFRTPNENNFSRTVPARKRCTKWTRNCVQCKKMFGPYFKARACADACVETNGLINLDCNNPETIITFLKR